MKYFGSFILLLILFMYSIPANADFIIYPNGDTKFGKIEQETSDYIVFQFGCEKTENNTQQIKKKDLLNFGPHPYCQFPPQKMEEKK